MPRTPRAEQFDPNEVGIVGPFGRCQAPILTGRVADGTIVAKEIGNASYTPC